MIRAHVICEGKTEETFVIVLLQEYFYSLGINLLPSKIGKAGHKGGYIDYSRLFDDVIPRLKKEKDCYCTTLIDFYGLKSSFPGKTNPNYNANNEQKLQYIIDSLVLKISPKLGNAINRFIPYFQMYEFEALLFSQPDILAKNLGKPSLAFEFNKIRNGFSSPEEINDSPQTAPSKRIKSLCYEYDKLNDNILVAKEIGLETIRKECHLFNEWLKKLEALAVNGGQI